MKRDSSGECPITAICLREALVTNHLDANDMLDKVLHVIAHAEANPLNDKKDQSIVISLLIVVRQVYAHHVRPGS